MDEVYNQARRQLQSFFDIIKTSNFSKNDPLFHSYQLYFGNDKRFIDRLLKFSQQAAQQLEPLVSSNHKHSNLPELQAYDALGNAVNHIQHHPTYIEAGNIIYGSGIMDLLIKPGSLLKALSLFHIASHSGEAGHLCPLACSSGILRILHYFSSSVPSSQWVEKLTAPSYAQNYTGAQFLTEIQGGSDVGSNALKATKNNQGEWKLHGEKWFCSNANADLILLTARFDEQIKGTKGLGLFLMPRYLDNGSINHFDIRRLKDKFGTQTMATGEFLFHGSIAYPIGELKDGIHYVLEHVLHLSRLFNAFSVLGMSKNAFQIAHAYAQKRIAFDKLIVDFPLVAETLCSMLCHNVAMMAASMHLAEQQDVLDQTKNPSSSQRLLLRSLVNLNKYYTSFHTVALIREAISILAGNGTIESFSPLPRLLRDAIVCENWEGTHFTLWMQLLRDIHTKQADRLLINYLSQLVQKISSQDKHLDTIHNKVKVLLSAINNLKTLEKEQQSLAIASWVSDFQELFCAICLKIESQRLTCNSKQNMADFFIDAIVLKKANADPSRYLKLIKDILLDL